MNVKAVMGTLMCFSVIGLQDIDIFAQVVNREELTSLSKSKSMELRSVIEDNVVIKKINMDVSAEIGSLSKGSVVEVVEDLDEWSKITIKGQTGYIKSKYLTKLNTTERVNYIDNIDEIDIYSEAEMGSKIIGKLSMYDKVRVVEEVGSFIKINYNGKMAYIKNDKEVVVSGIKRFVKNNTILYKKDNKGTYKADGLIKENTVVTVLENKDKYLKVSSNAGIGYVRKDKLENRKYVSVDNLKVEVLREKASDYSDIKTYIVPNAKVNLISYVGDYAKVAYGDYEGYVKRGSLSKSSEKINTGDFIDKYKISDEYKIREIQDEVIDIIKSEISKYKRKSEKESDEIIFKKYRTAILKTLEEELVKCFNMSKIKKSDTIDVIFNYGGYLKVEINGASYYVKNEGYNLEDGAVDSKVYIQTLPTYDTTSKTRYINKNDAKLYSRDEVSINSKFNGEELNFIGYLVKDSIVELVKELDNGYSVVKVNDIEAVIKSSYLSINKIYTKVRSDIKSVSTNKSHKNYVDSQIKKLNIVSKGGGMVNASYEDLAYYTNPNKLNVNSSKSKYQYLRLDQYRNINVYKLNEYLNNIQVPAGKEHIFKDKGDVFVSAAKKYNIDVIYLVAHTLLETGFGSSKLAQGIKYNNGETVYNFFGIGAYDSSPIKSGVKTAFNKGWTTIDSTIEGSAEWLSRNYINHAKRNQNTLYKMRFNYASNGSHQYATDVGWSYKISVLMNELSYLYEDTLLSFEVPKYKAKTYVSKEVKSEVDKGLIVKDEEEEELQGPSDEEISDKPAVPEVSDKPILPSKPGVSDKPILPSKPGVSDKPDKPSVPEESDKPAEPIIPDVPEESDKPSVPEEDKTEDSNDTDMPINPSIPEVLKVLEIKEIVYL